MCCEGDLFQLQILLKREIFGGKGESAEPTRLRECDDDKYNEAELTLSKKRRKCNFHIFF